MQQPGDHSDSPTANGQPVTITRPPETPPRRRRRLLAAAVTLALVCALVAAFGAVALLGRQRTSLSAPQAISPGSAASAAGWRLYHDPLRLFTLRLPPGWTATSDLGTYSEGDPQGSFSGQDETISFHDPSRGAGSTNLSVFAVQIPNSPVAATMNCNARARETTTFNGYPADATLSAVIMFESANAHFQIDETIPGVLVPVHSEPMIPPPSPTAAPAATVTADKALLATMLATFQPTDAKPLACP